MAKLSIRFPQTYTMPIVKSSSLLTTQTRAAKDGRYWQMGVCVEGSLIKS